MAQSKIPTAFTEIQKDPDERSQLLGLALVHHAKGNSDEADRALNKLVQKYHTGIHYEIADVYAYRGENDKAFEWLEQAYLQHDGSLIRIKTDPLLRSLHRDPRWPKFLKKMNLPI